MSNDQETISVPRKIFEELLAEVKEIKRVLGEGKHE